MASYATPAEANIYFGNRLFSELWDDQTPATKTIALEQATRAIDRLSFAGEKAAANLVRVSLTGSDQLIDNHLSRDEIRSIWDAGATQVLEFPRGTDVAVPADIKTASFEIAFALIDGVIPEKELEDLGVISQGYSSVRTTYDRSFVPEHTLAGIPSAEAWRYLKPFLMDDSSVRFNRV